MLAHQDRPVTVSIIFTAGDGIESSMEGYLIFQTSSNFCAGFWRMPLCRDVRTGCFQPGRYRKKLIIQAHMSLLSHSLDCNHHSKGEKYIFPNQRVSHWHTAGVWCTSCTDSLCGCCASGQRKPGWWCFSSCQVVFVPVFKSLYNIVHCWFCQSQNQR